MGENIMRITTDAGTDTRAKRIKELNDFLEKENISLEETSEDIIDKLMTGKIRDIGGLTAIRGFLYQYYVAIYYMVSMIYPKKDAWWNIVVWEYFDDVTLLSEDKVRFVQVKTIRENVGKRLTPSDYYNRKHPKDDETSDFSSYFNSWIDKLFYNYDYFLDNHLKDEDDEKYTLPEFELATNSPFYDGLTYSTNYNFNLNSKFPDDDKFLNHLSSVKVNDNEEVTFNQIMKKDLEYYLNRLFINHLGSSIELKQTILDMITETIGFSDLENRSIAFHIFNKFFDKVFSGTSSDAPNITLQDLTFSKEFVQELFDEGKIEGREILASNVNNSSVFSMFKRAVNSSFIDINTIYKNENIRKDLLDTLSWFYNSCQEEFDRDPKFLVVFLNKLFEMNNELPSEDYVNSENEYFLKNSIMYIVNCLAFYFDKKIEFKKAKLLFHSGEHSNEPKLLFTIFNAQNRKDVIRVKNDIATTIQYCNITNSVSEEFYCLVVDEKITGGSENDDEIAAILGITTIKEEQPKLIDSVHDLKFFNKVKMDEFISKLKVIDDSQVSTLKNEKIVEGWRKMVAPMESFK
ncbi:hypothetical protein GCM10008986_24770 [Salinibacillus aidingensis]|uniref:CD-NTase associated protein 4-like DNA endonuclease domain-containing protein n=1 Tax=Salinibacillus aidingensis TaxID=237684 RepID=A0ABN1BFQ5_9BACI